MGLTRILVVCAIIVAAIGYWAYSPLPPGYSSSTRRKFHFMMAVNKIFHFASRVGASLGFGTEAALYRGIVAAAVHYGLKEMKNEGLHGVRTSDTIFDGIPVRIYRPSDTLNNTLPGIVYFHGGGGIIGSIDSCDSITRRLCNDTKTVVVSVEYRLAPEFPFPAAVDDCTTATKYFLTNAAKFNVDPNRVAVAGDSAGGNLAASVSLRLCDEQFPIRLKLQVLLYPFVQGLDFSLPSMLQNSKGPLLTKSMMTFCLAMTVDGNLDRRDAYSDNRHVTKSFRETIAKTYMNLDRLPKEFLTGYVKPNYPDGDEKLWSTIKGTLLNPYYAPLVADNLEDLPDAFIFTANFDPLRDEGWLYAAALKEAKNRVTIYNAENGFHGVVNYVGIFPEALPMFAEITNFIQHNL